MIEPHLVTISLGGLADYVTARPSQKLAAVRGLVEMYGGDYNPGRDFYRDIREAIDAGLVHGDDARRVRLAVEECHQRQRTNYQAVAAGWQQWRGRRDLRRYADTVYWREGQLNVRVSPRFVWHQRLNRDLVYPYFKEPELSRDAAQAAIRIMELVCPREAGRPAILDIRRGQIHRGRRRDRDYDTWLRTEMAGLLRMYESLRPAA